jgi:hypothetical protein
MAALWEPARSSCGASGAGEIVVVDDGRVSFAIIGSPAALAPYIDEIQGYMLHTYCLVPDWRICFCMTMEGDAFLCGV